MNRVGVDGRGESIWLGWFLHATLKRFTPLAALMQEDPAPYLQQAENLSRALEAHAWDGDWYLRAFYDDGSRLGSSQKQRMPDRCDCPILGGFVGRGRSRASGASHGICQSTVGQAGRTDDFAVYAAFRQIGA